MAKRKLELKAGCWVRLRRGWIVGPLIRHRYDGARHWRVRNDAVFGWYDEGRVMVHRIDSDDIMAVVPKPRKGV